MKFVEKAGLIKFDLLGLTTLSIINDTIKLVKKYDQNFKLDKIPMNDKKTFEQINIPKSVLGEKGKFLKENLEVNVSFYDDKPLMVQLPNQINCKIESTDVALKGQTVSSSYKPAILENGLKIQVPPFIENGDTIIVDTRSIEYIKKI